MLSSQVNWGDRTLCHWLKHALPDCIKDSLTLVEEPVAFNDWKCLVQNIDQQYWERQAEIHQDTWGSQGNNANCGLLPMSVHNTTPGVPAASTPLSAWDHSSNPPVSCHLTAQGGLMQTEWDWWITQGLCLYCGGQGHKASKCSKAQKARETNRRAAQATESMPSPTSPSTMPSEPKITVISEN